MKSISKYAKQAADEYRAKNEAALERRRAEEARVQAIVDQNIPLYEPAGAERRDNLRALAVRHMPIPWSGIACDNCKTELIVSRRDVGFGVATDEIFDCLGCGFHTSVRR